MTTLNNVQNSLFIPNLGRFLNRRPTYNLTQPDSEDGETSSSDDGDEQKQAESTTIGRPRPSRTTSNATLNTLTSRVNDRYFAVLPHGVSLPGWTEEEKLELNDHVRHMLHSKRSKFKRGLKGFGQYFRTRKAFRPAHGILTNFSCSPWSICDYLCNTNHTFRPHLGSLFDRLDLHRKSQGLYCQRYRQHSCCSIRYHGGWTCALSSSRHLPHVLHRTLSSSHLAASQGESSAQASKQE